MVNNFKEFDSCPEVIKDFRFEHSYYFLHASQIMAFNASYSNFGMDLYLKSYSIRIVFATKYSKDSN